MNRMTFKRNSFTWGLLVLVVTLSACATQIHQYDPSPQSAVEQRAVVKEQGSIRIAASVPSTDEAERLFGLPLQNRGIQAVWIEITNNGANRARFAPYSVDRNYFPPYEVAYMFRKSFRKSSLGDLETFLQSVTMPRRIPAGETRSGYVFTNADPGTKSFNVVVFKTGDVTRPYEHFLYFVDVPGFVPDHAAVDFRSLYDAAEIRELDRPGFRRFLQSEWHCCSRNHDNSLDGRPANVIFVAAGKDLLRSMLQAGWSEIGLSKDDNYLLNSEYYFNRPPDAKFRKKRESGRDRDEISIWLAPVLVDGTQVWVAQVKHAIGRRFDIGEYLFGAILDPDADEGRNYVLQDMWYAQSLLGFAWSDRGPAVSEDNPRMGFDGNPWYSDGYVAVLWISADTISLKDTEIIRWDSPRNLEAPAE